MGNRVADLLRPFRDRPSTAGLFCDFDGTLAAIVTEPDQARPVPGAIEAMVAAAARLARVEIVSGRPVDFLAPWVPPAIAVHGLYGLERLAGGVRSSHPALVEWVPVVQAEADRLDAARPGGLLLERKGGSFTLHFRESPELEAAARGLAHDCQARSGLVPHEARMSVEMRPPIDVDKGTVVREAAEGLAAVAFVGDDLGDLAAFDALDDLAVSGVATLRVAVAGEEVPAELLRRADLAVDGPSAVVELVASLA